MSANHETDSAIENNNKSWEVEWSSSIREFDDYSNALDLFNLKSNQGEDTILYEIQKSKLDGSIVKRIPILNTKQSRKRKEELGKKSKKQMNQQQPQHQTTTQTKNKIGDIKYRIIILIVIIIAFLILLYVLSQLVTSSNTLDNHYLLYSFLNNNMDFPLNR